MVEYTLTLTNLGNVQDTFDLTSSGVWTVHFPVTQFTLANGESTSVTVHVTVPLDAHDGDFDVSTITATSQGDGSSDSSTLTTTAAVPVTAAVDLEPAEDAQTATAGGTAEYHLTLTNLGPAEDTITLSAENYVWMVHFPVTSFTLASTESVDVTVHVFVPVDVNEGDFDTAEIYATSGLDPAVFDTSDLTTTVVAIKLYLPIIFLR